MENLLSQATQMLAKSNGSISVCVDDEVLASVPVMNQITDGVVMIPGNFNEAAARILTNLINVGALPFKLEELDAHYNDPRVAEKMPAPPAPETPETPETPDSELPVVTSLSTTIGESEYILPDSSSRTLASDDLRGLSKDELRIARNEIFARYGRQFNDESLRNYFNSKSWYVALPKLPVNADPTLTKLEIANIELIKAYEAR